MQFTVDLSKHLWYQEIAKRKHEVPNEDVLEHTAAKAAIESEFEEHEQRIRLYRHIQKLEEPYRSVIYLRLASDLSFEEIGQVLERPGNWARVTYYRAKERLKQFEKD